MEGNDDSSPPRDNVDSSSQHQKNRNSQVRSKRSRKRPRSERHPNGDESHIESKVIPLTLEGKKIAGGPEYLRLVLPYLYNFTSYAKARWVGRTVLDVYTSEFGGYPPSYYEMAIQQGRILVSDQQVDTSYIIKSTDVLVHCVHRHEPGVAVSTTEPPYVSIAGESSDILAINKPGTLPIHPCGGYHQNSLMKILEKDERLGKFYTIHRLDRLTSGLVILGKSSAVARSWAKAIQQREHCEKLYLARVKGKFPLNCPASVPCLRASGSSSPVYGEWRDKASVERNRDRHALGYWMENSRGKHLDDESLESFSRKIYDVEKCLLDLKLKEVASPDVFAWLRLACPVRVAERKRGVCVSESQKIDEMLR